MSPRARTPGVKPWSKAKTKQRELSPDEQWAEQIRERVLADAHPWQADAIEDPARFFMWLVGRGGGKTTAFKGRYVLEMARVVKGRFLFAAPTLGMATDLLWDPLKETCAALSIEADFKEVGKICTFRRTGSRLKLVGADDRREMGKQRGQPFNGVGLDEACEFTPELLEWFVQRIIRPRIGERKGWIGIASTPGHQLRGLFYDGTRPGSTRPDGTPFHRPYRDRDNLAFKNWGGWSSHEWSLKDVAELPNAAKRYPAIVANWEAALDTKFNEQFSDDNPIWMREYLGKWVADNTTMVFRYRAHLSGAAAAAAGVPDGTAWNQWDPERVGPMRVAKLPAGITDWVFVITMDEGVSDPFACNVLAASPSDPRREVLHVWGFEQPKMYAQPIAKLLIGEQLDHERPGGLIGQLGWPDGMIGDFGNVLIEELLNVYGIKVVQSDRSHKYKFAAIEVVNGDFFDGRLRILKGSVLEEQVQELQWATDEFGGLKENKAQANHSTDTLINGRIVIGQLITSSVPPEPAPPSSPAAELPPPPPPPEDEISGGGSSNEFGSLLGEGAYGDLWGND